MSADDKKELLNNQAETAVVDDNKSNDPNDIIETSSLNLMNESKPVPSKKQPSTKSQVQRDYEQLNRFLSPMLDDLDKLVATNLKEMDKIEELVNFLFFFFNKFFNLNSFYFKEECFQMANQKLMFYHTFQKK